MLESAKIKYDNMIVKFLPAKAILVRNLNFFDLKEILHFEKFQTANFKHGNSFKKYPNKAFKGFFK